MSDETERIQKALDIILRFGGIDGAHHKQWCLDQVVRVLTDCPIVELTAINCRGIPYSFKDMGVSPEYAEWKRLYSFGEDGSDDYGEWDVGIAP